MALLEQAASPGLAPATSETADHGSSWDDHDYALVFEASPSGLLLVGPDGRILMVNAHVEAMFGYHRSELIGQPLDILMPKRFRGSPTAQRLGLATGKMRHPPGTLQGILALRHDGSEFPVEIGLNPGLLDGRACVIAAVQDVSEQLAAQSALAQQRLELERSNADLAEFANAASHDLKAPLRGISHLAHWVADDVASGKVGAETLENCALLASRADRMQRLLDGLLAFAKVGRGEMQPDSVDTAEMIRDLVPGLALPPGFSVVVDGAMPVISTLRLHLEVIFQNLIENAVKHHDRASGRVTISAVTQERWVCFTVTDDGPGIAPRNHARIFRMFQTLARHDSSGSTGIGLAIVKKKVTMLGGTIEVHSNPPERGTSFVFTWPRQTGPTQMWRHPAAPGKPRQSEIAT